MTAAAEVSPVAINATNFISSFLLAKPDCLSGSAFQVWRSIYSFAGIAGV